MMKLTERFSFVILLLGLVFFSSCSFNPSNRKGGTEGMIASENQLENTSTPAAATPTEQGTASPKPSPQEEEKESKVIQVKAEETIGMPIKVSELDSFGLNQRLLGIIDGSSPHGIEDYTRGIVPTNNALILNERYTDEVIAGISLGTGFDKIRETLGEPGWETDDILLYRNWNYYLLFQGNQKADFAVLMEAPEGDSDPDLLKVILEALNEKDYLSLDESLKNIDPEGLFFDDRGFINGGGYYLSSKNGINIIDFDEKYIEVYNNYQGTHYKYTMPDSRFELRFIDRDMVIDYMLSELNRYLEVEELFLNEGIVSPDGKLCAVYEWLYSMNHHFIVRTLDYSIQDRYIHVSSESDFYWLTSSHLIYMDPYNQIPYAIDVNFSNPGAINILYEAGVIKARDVDPGNYEFDIVEVKPDSVLLKDRINDKDITIQFSEDKKGNISFKVK